MNGLERAIVDELRKGEPTPFERGEAAGLRGDAAPAFPGPDSSWADRLFHRGWQVGAGKRAGIYPGDRKKV